MGIEEFLLQRAEEQAVKKGFKIGQNKMIRMVIRNGRVEEKFSIETIANIVGLTPERVRKILDKMDIE